MTASSRLRSSSSNTANHRQLWVPLLARPAVCVFGRRVAGVERSEPPDHSPSQADGSSIGLRHISLAPVLRGEGRGEGLRILQADGFSVGLFFRSGGWVRALASRRQLWVPLLARPAVCVFGRRVAGVERSEPPDHSPSQADGSSIGLRHISLAPVLRGEGRGEGHSGWPRLLVNLGER